MSTPELEKEYSPTAWSKRFPTGEDVINHHLEFVKTSSEKARAEFPTQLSVKYGDAEIENYDIYGTHLPKDSPIFVYIHGGYWQILTKDLSAYCVQPLVANGTRVVIVEYELCPKITLADLVKQLQRAGLHLLDFAASSGSKISFGGHSAGAHLLISMLSPEFLKQAGANAKLLAGAFLISGVYDLTILRHLDQVNKDNILSLSDDNEARLLSPIYQDLSHISTLKTSFFVFVAENDSQTFINQSRDLYEKLKAETRSKVSYKLMPKLDHFDIVENLSLVDYDITKCILENLKR